MQRSLTLILLLTLPILNAADECCGWACPDYCMQCKPLCRRALRGGGEIEARTLFVPKDATDVGRASGDGIEAIALHQHY